MSDTTNTSNTNTDEGIVLLAATATPSSVPITSAKLITLLNPKDPSQQFLPRTSTLGIAGIENVDNTSDLDKPVSTLQQAAIDAAKTEVQTDLTDHIGDTVKHITAEEREKWNEGGGGKSYELVLEEPYILTDQAIADNTTFTLPSSITLTEGDLYWLNVELTGTSGTVTNGQLLSKVTSDAVSWNLGRIVLNSTSIVTSSLGGSIVISLAKVSEINYLSERSLMHMEGSSCLNSGIDSHVEGQTTTASGPTAHAEGMSTIASAEGSHAEGNGSKATAPFAHAEGMLTAAEQTASHAEGTGTKATGQFAHAEGLNTTAEQTASHAEGNNTKATGTFAHAEGMTTTAEKTASHAEGNETKATASYAHAEGMLTTASGESSHAEGGSSKATATHAHAEGNQTTASAGSSHSQGVFTTASGQASHAEGIYTASSGQASHAEGLYTLASSAHQHAQGKYNIEDANGKYVHIIGNGTSETARTNAHTVDWDGNAWFAGDVYVGGTGQDDAGAVKLALAPLMRTITLTAAGWNSTALTQTVTVSGVSADESAQAINWTPNGASQTACYDAGVKCTAQAANSLTFGCDILPSTNLTIYVTIQEVRT